MTCKLIPKKSSEWETDMWVAAIGIKKAFDSMYNIEQQSGDPSETTQSLNNTFA